MISVVAFFSHFVVVTADLFWFCLVFLGLFYCDDISEIICNVLSALQGLASSQVPLPWASSHRLSP